MGTDSIAISRFPVYDRDHLPEPDADYSGGAVFLVDKPSEWTSFDVVKFLRNRIRIRKTGHAGTLDPSATGLLVVCAGKATKVVSRFQEYSKRYHVRAALGASTPSQDHTTEPDAHAPSDHLDRAMIEQVAVSRFTGTIRQIPPMYSALRKDGKRLYHYARKGQVVEREPREVNIHELNIVSLDKKGMELNVLCSKGTYIRTLVHDLGAALGTLAHLVELRRTEIGPYRVERAITIDRIRTVFDGTDNS